MGAEVWIGELRVPDALVRAIADGRWRPPADELLAEVFQDEPDGARFYDVPTMRRQNEFFHQMDPGKTFGIQPAQALLIGDLGADMPIALDFSTDPHTPRVRYLRIEEWLDIAPDIDTLLNMLHL